MGQTYNIYCDESCHLENDKIPVMVLGAIWCRLDSARTIAEKIREIKVKNGLSKFFETKWTKVSKDKLQYYLGLLDYFFDCGDLHFRAVIIPDKSKLTHSKFGQTHDDWYYKMYFTMLKQILSPIDEYNIYLDIKDTRGSEKVKKLHEVLCNDKYDFSKSIIKKVQLVRSHEIEQLQLADLLIGSISYVNRDLKTSPAKINIVERVKEKTQYSLKQTTLLKEEKFNLLRWHPQEENL